MNRKATAIWQGTGKEGSGKITTQSTALNDTPLSFKSRFEEGVGTNPEELIAAAHAGCFTMKLSFVLNEAGFTADFLETTAIVTLEDGAISNSHLILTAKIPTISAEVFATCVKDAEVNCPISKVLNTNITVETHLQY